MARIARPKTERKKKSSVAALPPEAANNGAAVANADTVASISSSDIALRAFTYYCERGCQDGAALEDWLRAERELLGSASARSVLR